jgi:hypothetical protein
MTETPPPAPKVRLIDSMPRPLLVVFVIAGLVAIVAVLVVIINPPIFSTVPVQDRRPPPRGDLSHNTGGIAPLFRGDAVPLAEPPCPAVETDRLRAGPAGIARLRGVLVDICTLSKGGVSPDVTAAIKGLKGATIGFAVFDRAGVESTAVFQGKLIWLNGKFARSDLPVEQIAPVVLHEGYHLAHPNDPVTAREELGARTAEVSTCRLLIPLKKWPRWCKDARTLTDLPVERALELLVSAGYKP